MPGPQDSYPRSLLPPDASAPLASSREDVDPAQLGALVARLAHGPTKPLTPPRQSSQPVLSPAAAASIVPPRAAAVSHAQVPVAHIGAPVVGERFVPPTFSQMMTSANPAQGLAEHFIGQARPRAVQSADPYGDQAWLAGAGPPPMFMGSTEEVGAAGRGLFSRVDDVAASLPERGLHPNKVASLLKSGAAQEEVAYRKLPEFLASKGNNPVTRAEMQAHLQANPAPVPSTTVLGEPRSPDIQRQLDEITRLRDYGGQISHREWQRRRDLILGNSEKPTKYQSYSLPGGDAYREHLLQLPEHSGEELAQLELRRNNLRHAMGTKVSEMDVPAFADDAARQAWVDERMAERKRWSAEYDDLTHKVNALQTRQQPYQEGHYGGEYPNVLAHVRTTERRLPPLGNPDEIAERVRQAVGARSIQSLASGSPEVAVRKGAITPEEAAIFGHAAGFTNYPEPPGARGRFLEEVQSDWHQTGKRVGYQGVTTPEQQARIAQLVDEIPQARERMADLYRQHTDARNTYLAQLEQATRTHLPPEYQHLRSFSDALNEAGATHVGDRTGPVPAWRAARERAFAQGLDLAPYKLAEEQLDNDVTAASAHHQTLVDEHRKLTNPSGVPDSPYKEAWPDLALKQQLLDVARDPHANWLGFTSGQTQAARYDLSKQVSQLSFEPHSPGDYSMGDLVALDHQGDEVIRQRVSPEELDDHIGKEPANALRQKIAEHQRSAEYDRSQWSVGHDTDNHNYFHIYDPNGEPLHTYDGALEHFRSEDAANARIDELLARDQETNQQHPFISGLDLQVGGEGMTHFYDNLLPARLRKLVKPFGGTVEPFDLPASKEGFRILNQHGEAVGRYDNLRNAQADLPNLQRTMPNYQLSIAPPAGEPSWITRLTPEMKREILRRGFPLLTLPLTVGAASLASRPGADVGQPPPVQPPPR